MFNQQSIPRGVALALLGAALGSALPALAQDSTSDIGTVVVTGSRITRTNLESTTPVLSIGRQEFDALGYENIADLATALPQFSPAFGASRTQSTFSGSATSGLNQANLRNLGALRSVTLINGRRVPAGSPQFTSVDFNLIPTANIERIEVLTGGAAAIYGADAVAGVINIITKKDFEGIELGASYGAADEGDNENPSAYLLLGGAFAEQGHGLLTLQYDKQGEVSCADRFLCEEDFFWNNPAAAPLRGPPAYSGVGVNGRFFVPGIAGSVTRRDGSFTDANGNLIQFSVPVDGYNRNAARDIAIPTERILLMAEGEYELGAGASVFLELTYGQSETDSAFEGHPFQSQQAGSLVGGGPGVPGLQATIPLNNPFVPASILNAATITGDPALDQITWWQRFNFFGLRGANNDRESIRGVLGFKGGLESMGGFGQDWSWELSHVYGRHNLDSSTEGFVGTDRLYNSLRVEQDPNAPPGTYRCIDATARATGCVPVNPFAPYTQAMIDYLSVAAGQRGKSELQDSLAVLSGSLFELPAGPLKAAIGLERRVFSGNLDYDEVITQGLVSGNQILDTPFAEIRTKEAYFETLVPLLRDKPGAYALSVEGAYRVSTSDYLETSEDYDTWKYGGDWAPIQGLRFRAMRARSVRVPTPGELGGGGQTFGVVNDPCTAARIAAANNPTRTANCTADGVAAGYAPPTVVEQGVAGFVVGNPTLAPEEATTLTYGVVWTPTFVRNLELSVDRFEIEVDGFVNTLGRQTIADACYDTADRQFCNLVTRGTNPVVPGANYVLNAVNDSTANLSAYDIAGYDLEVHYGFGLASLFRSEADFGSLAVSLLATIYDKAETVPRPGSEVLDLLGFAGGSTSDQGFLKKQGILNLSYERGAINANWHTRYIGPTEMTPFEPAFPEIGSHVYHDVRLGFSFGDKGSEVYAGVTNLFDKDPPFFASGTSGTQALDTIPAFYDVFGRSYYAGTRIKF
ncbi:MAG TPA: TonB-dependent receptor [Steroidobacteraceae bacterium]|nr:TonB-dependent receptor [Steroidobacteraceae bacterium]